jgi:hypothetical protein
LQVYNTSICIILSIETSSSSARIAIEPFSSSRSRSPLLLLSVQTISQDVRGNWHRPRRQATRDPRLNTTRPDLSSAHSSSCRSWSRRIRRLDFYRQQLYRKLVGRSRISDNHLSLCRNLWRPCPIHRRPPWLPGPRYVGHGHQHHVGQFLDRDWNFVRFRGTLSQSSSFFSRLLPTPEQLANLVSLIQAAGAIEPHAIHTHFPELACWFVVLAVFTWSSALAASARDLVLTGCLTSLAIGSTIACCLFSYNGGTSTTSGSGDGETGGVTMGIKAASYFWMLSSLLAWWRVTVYLVEEAFGSGHAITRFFPIGRTPMEKRAPLVIPGLGEPGVKRGVPKPI